MFVQQLEGTRLSPFYAYLFVAAESFREGCGDLWTATTSSAASLSFGAINGVGVENILLHDSLAI